jgi:hypothetical protein
MQKVGALQERGVLQSGAALSIKLGERDQMYIEQVHKSQEGTLPIWYKTREWFEKK